MTHIQNLPSIEPDQPSQIHRCLVDPGTGGAIYLDGAVYRAVASDDGVAHIHSGGGGGVVDFVGSAKYASSFSYQWLKTKAVRSLHPQLMDCHQREMDLRTGFDSRDLSGARCLEIGAGLGDDTAYMLTKDIADIYALDLSKSIFRAAELIDDARVHFIRADVNALPFRPGSFDVVICHRMIQHTPDPEATLTSAASMVRPGGILFAHSYHKSKYFNASAKYKYRWFTTRIPTRALWKMLAFAAPILKWGSGFIGRIGGQRGSEWVRRWSPWVILAPQHLVGVDRKTCRQYELQVTFDSLSPKYDIPMYSQDFVDLIEGLGFTIEHLERRPWYPLWATAVKGHTP